MKAEIGIEFAAPRINSTARLLRKENAKAL